MALFHQRRCSRCQWSGKTGTCRRDIACGAVEIAQGVKGLSPHQDQVSFLAPARDAQYVRLQCIGAQSRPHGGVKNQLIERR